MKHLCKKAEINVLNDYHIMVGITALSGDYSFYHNNIGPASISFNFNKIVESVAFLQNDCYTLPRLEFVLPRRNALNVSWFDPSKSWTSTTLICHGKYYFDQPYYDNDSKIKTVVMAINQTNEFIQYLKDKNLLRDIYKGIPELRIKS